MSPQRTLAPRAPCGVGPRVPGAAAPGIAAAVAAPPASLRASRPGEQTPRIVRRAHPAHPCPEAKSQRFQTEIAAE